MRGLDDAFRFARDELELIDPDAALDSLTLDALLTDVDLDSVALLSLVAALEDRYETRVSELELMEVKTVRDLLQLALEGHGGQ